MYMPTEMPVTQHMLDEILERLGDDCPSEDRLAVRRWYEQSPINVTRDMLRNVMTVVMHGPDAGDTTAPSMAPALPTTAPRCS